MSESVPNVATLMFIAYRSIENRVFAALAEGGFGEVTVAQGRLLARIGPQGNRLTDLAEQSQITKQTAGFLVDQLERAGYVERIADPTDGRARLVRLAERGIRCVQIANAEAGRVELEWENHLGARQIAQLRTIMARLREIADPYA
ncbi:MarR family winged helix-turn-helix transcriptional regulator [Nocardia sp. NPDC060256]|uniref:MarR family winged helix-turn-helix transcriptional regulator n=1 Tax=unclassified Nocardia TaxID=2637762 RepID=UPI00364FC4BF